MARNNPIIWPYVGIGTLIRLLFWSTSIYIFYLCYGMVHGLNKEPTHIEMMLMCHVLFATLGCCLLGIEATLVITGDVLLSQKVSKKGRIKLHWILHTSGLICLIISFVTVFEQKYGRGAEHFYSRHGRVGLVGYILPVVLSIAAVPIVWTKILPRCCSLAHSKYIHIYLGIIGHAFLWVGQISGIYKNWWPGSDLGTSLISTAYLIGGFLMLAKPYASTVTRHFESSI